MARQPGSQHRCGTGAGCLAWRWQRLGAPDVGHTPSPPVQRGRDALCPRILGLGRQSFGGGCRPVPSFGTLGLRPLSLRLPPFVATYWGTTGDAVGTGAGKQDLLASDRARSVLVSQSKSRSRSWSWESYVFEDSTFCAQDVGTCESSRRAAPSPACGGELLPRWFVMAPRTCRWQQ